MRKPVVVMVTTPDEIVAEKLARHLVDDQVAACVNIIPGIRSIYRWEGETKEDGEVLLIIKSTADRVNGIIADVRANHPYSIPEIISLPIQDGSADYLNWIRDSIRTERPSG